MSRNLRNAMVAFGQQAVGAVGGAVGLFFIARQLPNAEVSYGVVGFALGFVGMFLAIQRAFDGAHVKRVSEGQDVARCNSTYALLNIGSTLAMVGLVLGSVFVWTTLLGRGFETPLHLRAIQLIIIYQVLNSLGEFVRRMYEGRGNILVGQLILSVEHVVKAVAMVYVAFNGLSPFFRASPDAINIATAFVAGAGALAVASVLLLAGQPFGKPSWTLVKHYWTFALPTTLTSSLFLLTMNIPIVMLQLFWASGAVGVYTASQRYILFLPAIATAASTALFPVYSSMHAQGRTHPDMVRRTVRLISLGLLPALSVTLVVPEGILHVLVSDRFLDGAIVLTILAFGAYVDALRRTMSTKLGGVNRPVEVTKAGLASLTASVVLSVVLIAPSLFGVPLFGLRLAGPALAVVAAQFVGMGTILRAVKTYAGVTLPNLWRHAVILAGAAGALWLYAQVFPPLLFRVYHLVGAGVLACVVVVALAILLRELDDYDRQLIGKLLHPGEWADFMREETGRRPRGRPEDAMADLVDGEGHEHAAEAPEHVEEQGPGRPVDRSGAPRAGGDPRDADAQASTDDGTRNGTQDGTQDRTREDGEDGNGPESDDDR